MPEWSIGPHSKCGERATVPRVRIPLFPQIIIRQEGVVRHLFCFIYLVESSLENKIYKKSELRSSLLSNYSLPGPSGEHEGKALRSRASAEQPIPGLK